MHRGARAAMMAAPAMQRDQRSEQMPTNLAQLLSETASRHGDRPALKLDQNVVSYQALNEGASRVAGLLKQRGLRPGDRVGIMLPNVPYFGMVYYGVLRAGGVVVPMNVMLKQREVSFYLTDSGAGHLFAWHEFSAVAEQGAGTAGTEVIIVGPGEFDRLLSDAPLQVDDVERDSRDTAVILYTSGTTGTPKGAELTHSNMLENSRYGGIELVDVSEQDVIFGALPLFHSFGQTCCLNTAVRAGACLTMIPRFEPGVALEIIARDKVTLFDGVPTMYHAMLNYPQRQQHDVSSLRTCVSGGAAMPVEVMRGFEAAFGCVILEGYGLSETSPVASFNQLHRERKPGSIGTPIPGVEMKIVDETGNQLPPGEVGEIAIRGHNVMKGYWNRPDATAEVLADGWLRTGDLARTDQDGYFFIVDRKKDMIIRGGYNVYPREIEEVLYEHPAILEAAVIAVPDPALGEEIGAAVVLRPQASVDPDEIREFVKERLAAYKYPRHVWFADQLPKGATGKILKRDIALPDLAAVARR
jgi:long-chain acyl-CoA synthetase